MSLGWTAKQALRRLIPKSGLLTYHRTRASLTALWFRYPARRMVVIGVTGTNGKTTVVSLISQMLEQLGEAVGAISTATIRIRSEEVLNQTKLTTASPARLQSLLQRMQRAGCRYAVLEASSEGLEQGRLNGIPLHIGVFTNLTPEHIESHGSFDAYARAKGRLFWSLSRSPRSAGRAKVAVLNIDDPAAEQYARFPVDRVVGCSIRPQPASIRSNAPLTIRAARDLVVDASGGRFTVDKIPFFVPLIGSFNIMNALEAVAVIEQLGFPLADIARALSAVAPVPGRLEFIRITAPFRVLVDYAPEPASMAALYSVLPMFHANRVIHVFGSAGGGRDRARRPILGKFVAERADIAIITNEDPYDESPEHIIADIVAGARTAQPAKALVEEILDRRQAIRRALALAQPGDLVVITGKASEQWIVGPQGEKLPWDDRVVVQEEAKTSAVEN